MKYEELFMTIVYLLLSGLIIYVIKLTRDKAKEIDSADIRNTVNYVLDIVEKVVGAINQNVVDSAKESGIFDRATAKSAKEKAMKDIDDILSDTSKDILSKGVGNIDDFLDKAVEAEVRKQKVEQK